MSYPRPCNRMACHLAGMHLKGCTEYRDPEPEAPRLVSAEREQEIREFFSQLVDLQNKYGLDLASDERIEIRDLCAVYPAGYEFSALIIEHGDDPTTDVLQIQELVDDPEPDRPTTPEQYQAESLHTADVKTRCC